MDYLTKCKIESSSEYNDGWTRQHYQKELRRHQKKLDEVVKETKYSASWENEIHNVESSEELFEVLTEISEAKPTNKAEENYQNAVKDILEASKTLNLL
tara:strand:- start:954 stop:1250 length:297 start_codon:yes stop_codon:yes gene_type:complete